MVRSTDLRYWNVPGSRSLISVTISVAVTVLDDEEASEAEEVVWGTEDVAEPLDWKDNNDNDGDEDGIMGVQDCDLCSTCATERENVALGESNMEA